MGAGVPVGAGVAGVAGVAALVGCDGVSDPGRGRPALYVASGGTDQVFRLDPGSGAILDTVPVDRRRTETDEPHGLALAPDGRSWLVTLAHGDPSVWRFDRDGDRLIGRLSLGTAGAARIGLAAGRAFIPDYDRDRAPEGRVGEVAVVELGRLELVRVLPLCSAPHDAGTGPDGRVAVTCSMSDEIVVLDPVTLEEVRRFSTGGSAGPPGTPAHKPLNLAWSPSGDRLFVTLHLADALGVYSPAGEPLATWPVGARPTQLAVTPDGATVVVANRGDGTAAAVDAATGAIRWRLEVGEHPHGVALDDDGAVAFIAFEGTTTAPGGVAAVRISDGHPLWTSRFGSYVLGILHAP